MKRILIFLGAAPLFSGAALAGQRRIAVCPVPRLPLASGPGAMGSSPRVEQRVNAQLVDTTHAHTVDIQGNSLALAPGDVVLLPFAGVTRIITDDDDVARAFFQNGSPVLQALAVGTTTVEIYQSSGTPRVLTITVSGSKTASPTTPAPLSPATPLPISPTPPPAPTPAPPAPTPAPPVPLPTPIPTVPLGNSGSTAISPKVPEQGDPLPEAPPASGGQGTTLTMPDPTGPILPSVSSLMVATRVATAPDDPSQAQFFVDFSNAGSSPARGVVVRFPLDVRVKLVPGSITNGGLFDSSTREVVWRVGDVPARSSITTASLRVTAVEAGPFSFASAATIEDQTGGAPITSSQVRYSTAPTPLLTVFALPDRFLAGTSGPRFTDVNAGQSLTVERLKQLGIVNGVAPGQYAPSQATRRAEYAVMTIKSLNLRDLRDLTQLKFVLSRHSIVNLWVQDASGARVADLVRGTAFEAGEHTVLWNGKTTRGLASAGRYTYVCTAKDGRGETTTLRGTLTVVNPTAMDLSALPSFVDVKGSDWFAHYLAAGEKQGLIFGYPDKTFRPEQAISRVQATAIIVRALGMSDLASKWADKDVGFLDYSQIPAWVRGDVNVATTLAKTGSGRPIMLGTVDNRFEPLNDLSRAQAALIVSRLIDREMTRHISISGSIVPGAVVSINSRPVSADGDGHFSFSLDMMTSTPTTLSVIDTRSNVY